MHLNRENDHQFVMIEQPHGV
ncbi:hypothetical protein ACQKEG_25430 [Klebsiella quasipneumoniae]